MPEKYRLFCAGFGSGKSEAMANAAVIDASHSASALIGCYAPTYDLVRLITAPRIQQKLTDNGFAYVFNKQENIIYTSSSHVGDFVLRTLDNPERIVGYETYRAHVDELDTLNTDKARTAWNQVIARNRQRPAGVIDPFNQASAYYERWVSNKNELYGMVQASTLSNPFLPPDYVDSLKATYPAQLIDAYIEGHFVNMQSGTVYRAYNRKAHDSTETIRECEPLFIGMDFNVTQQAATVYVKRKGGEEWHAVAELVDMYDTPDAIDTIKQRWPDHKINIYPDASGSARKTVDAYKTDISLLESAGFSVRVHKRNPGVQDRINATNSAFESGRLRINSKACPTVADCFEQQAYDKNGKPDKSAGKDHQNDASTYPIAFEMPIIKPMSNVNVKFSF
jgi:PBSX family phage terminase large subunit